MIEIDGSHGEGGGQILRTALALSAVTGKPFRLFNIRARRPKPGLMRQHLTAVKAAAQVCGAHAEGAELQAAELRFTPSAVRGGGAYQFDIGTAGSTLLVAQTVLPILLCADAPSCVTLRGGTHAAAAPVYEFFNEVFLPQLRAMGCDVTSELKRVGFYPAGGGEVTVTCRPCAAWKRLDLMERGALIRQDAVAYGAHINPDIAQDEVACIAKGFTAPETSCRAEDVESPGPGNVAFARVVSEHVTELFSCCGGHDLSRKAVGQNVANGVRNYVRSGVPVWSYLADQLLLPMAMGAGGCFRTCSPSQHFLTNVETIRLFMDVSVRQVRMDNNLVNVEIEK